MAWDIDQAKSDFEDFSLDEFGETIKYTPSGSSQRSIQAVVYKTKNASVNLGPANFRPARMGIEILISQHATAGVAKVTIGKDLVTMKINPGDTNEKVLTVQSCNPEYGVWRLGLLE